MKDDIVSNWDKEEKDKLAYFNVDMQTNFCTFCSSEMRQFFHLGDGHNDLKRLCSYLLFVGQGWVDKLAIEDTGALGVWGQEPDHKGNLELKVKWKPEK